MRAVQLEEIEPGTLAGLGRADELVADIAHLTRGQLVGHLVGG